MAKVSAFYRPFLGVAISRAGLRYPEAYWAEMAGGPEGRLEGVWISRGKGLGNGYGRTVGRRCLNEADVLRSLRASDVRLSLSPLELADMPFAEQLPHFRRAAVVTGMHGAGYANIIFMAPGGVVAELCPLGYCTQSFSRISERVGLTYMRWTNSIEENSKPGYDTIVDTKQFTSLMRKAVKAWKKAAGVQDGSDTSSSEGASD